MWDVSASGPTTGAMGPAYREHLAAALSAAGILAEVVFTQNRTTMVSVRRRPIQRGGRVLDREIRIAERFAALGEKTIGPIVAFASGKRGALEVLRELIREVTREERNAPSPARVRPQRNVAMRSRGKHHDLAQLAELERAAHFPELATLPITWTREGPATRSRRLRSIRLGSYDPVRQLIRIHPRLDDPRVPTWFIGFVIFHEYLHHALGIGMSRSGDRRELHPPSFRQAEARHPRYADALAWEAAHIGKVLSPSW